MRLQSDVIEPLTEFSLNGVSTFRLSSRADDADEESLVTAAKQGWALTESRIAQRLGGFRLSSFNQELDRASACVIEVDDTFLRSLAALTSLDTALMGTEPLNPRFRLADGTRKEHIDLEPMILRRFSQRDGEATRIHPVAAAEALQHGVTLILNDIAPLTRGPLLDLAHDISRVRGVQSQVNAYISEREAPGFGRHWDDHDVVIIQALGRKQWQIFEPGAIGPLIPWVGRDTCGDQVLSVVLEPGMGLFIPRGWPHAVRGFPDSVSAHLTIGNRRQLLQDAIDDIARHSDQPPTMGSEIPLPRWPGATTERIEDSIARFRAHIETFPYSGPLTSAATLSSVDSQTRVRAPIPGGTVFLDTGNDDKSRVNLGISGFGYSIRRNLVPVVAALVAGFDGPISDLQQLVPEVDSPAVIDIVTTLARRDVTVMDQPR